VHFALFYDTVPDYINRRQPYRQEHLDHARRAHDKGLLLMAGAMNPADSALFVFRAESAAEVEAFAKNDPYVIAGLIPAWRVREWTVVIGGKD
jgi:uncharacterized protein